MDLAEIIEIDGVRYLYFKESIPVLTLPEGVDPTDKSAKSVMESCEEMLKGVRSGKFASVILPYGYSLSSTQIIDHIRLGNKEEKSDDQN
jgi:hypothetical protein